MGTKSASAGVDGKNSPINLQGQILTLPQGLAALEGVRVGPGV